MNLDYYIDVHEILRFQCESKTGISADEITAFILLRDISSQCHRNQKHH